MFTRMLALFEKLTGHSERDVFKRTQGRLTLIYSGLLVLFLTLFIVIVSSVIYMVILKNQESELQALASQEANYFENYLQESGRSDLSGVQTQEVVFAGVNQAFYYVISANGNVITGNEADHRLRQDYLGLVTKGMKGNEEIHKETLPFNNHMRGRGPLEKFSPPNQKDSRLLIASRSIYYKGQFLGNLYVGKDISLSYDLFHWVFLILTILGAIFFGVALLISMVMSKRAMIPITVAFSRQREFVADASHELRSPLSVLLSSVDAMEMTIEPEKNSMVEKMLTNMRQEVKRMTHLVSDLLTLARSDSQTIEVRKDVFDIRPYADKIVESVRPLSDAKQITLKMNAPETLAAIGDPDRLSQLIYILLDNAIKYTPNEGEVRLSLFHEGINLGITVQDTGIGISHEDQQHIFERFYRADKSRSRQIGGHGLGLSIAKWITDTHNGIIQVQSQTGNGSKFIVQIPLKN